MMSIALPPDRNHAFKHTAITAAGVSIAAAAAATGTVTGKMQHLPP